MRDSEHRMQGDLPCNASVIRVRRDCIVSTRCNFLRRLRYNRAYALPSERRTDSHFAFGWRSTFLRAASSSSVMSSAR